MSDSISVRITLDSYDLLRPREKQTQVYVQIPEVARVSYMLPAERFQGLKDRAWPEVLDVADEHYERGWAVEDPATVAARAAVRAWLRDDANRDEVQAAFEADHARRDSVARKLLEENERLRSKVAELDKISDEALAERDGMHDALDEFAQAVAPEEVIGEHSSGNNPWANALNLLTPVAEVDKLRARVARLTEQSDLWKRGDLDTTTAMAGVHGELHGHPLPEVGQWDRARDAELVWLRDRVTELESDYVAPSPSCTRCYGADAARFVAQGGVATWCPVCGPSEVEQLRARVSELEARTTAAPVGLSAEQRSMLAQQLGDAQPARDELIASFAKTVADCREHEHPTWEDLFCMNLTSYMGERMAPVLRRLLDAEARVSELEMYAARYRTAWRRARTRALSTGSAADRYAARARELQQALQESLPAVLSARLERNAALARVAELEAAEHDPEADA